MTKLKEARSGILMENLDEMLNAEDSAGHSLNYGLNQYTSPEWLVKELAAYLPDRRPTTVFDPQCADGKLLKGWPQNWPNRFGIELDNRIEEWATGANLVRGNCVKVFEVIDDLQPDLIFHTFNANPPFGKRWTPPGGKVVDSTLWTWERSLKHGCQGIFITNHNTAVKLGIDKHPFVRHYKTYENVWKGCEVVIGAAVWSNPENVPTDDSEVIRLWGQLKKIVEEEKLKRPDFNIWMGNDGKLKTYLSFRSELKLKLERDQILKLHRIKDSHPLALTIDRETRKVMQELLDLGVYKIEPQAKQAIEDALASVQSLACPLMPVTDFERVAYLDEEDHVECVKAGGMDFTPGKKYEIRTATYDFVQQFKRKKVHFDEQSGTTYTADHECTLTGQDRYIELKDDQGIVRRFMDKPRGDVANEHDESLLWKIFRQPKVSTVAESCPDKVEHNRKMLKLCEMLAGYTYYDGQVEYLSRVLVKDYALIAAGTGCGKTLFAITINAVKAPDRCLIVAPQGTMRSSEDDDEGEEYQASQWVTELRTFAPYLQVFELFSMEDYHRIRSMNGGRLPHGVYITYYQALAQNGARESAPLTWDDARLQKLSPEFTVPEDPDGNKRATVETVGKEVNGIRCILKPSMATLIGDQFDMVLLDEAHTICNGDANVSQILIRLQPRYRYALTATPIPNVVCNLFNIMGWLCVQDWFKGDRRNAAWPYAREEIGRFESTFNAKERDLTQEDMKRRADSSWRGKCEKPSPVISSPARLLKLIKPTLAFISKEQVNSKYIGAKIVDVRVPMGKEQGKLYAHFLNRGNIKCGNPLVRARKQIAYLRNICADPAGFDHGGPAVRSNFNPKMIAILELIAEILARNEQVVIVCSRKGQSNSIARKLEQSGIPFSRIDSTIPPDQHAAQSNLFKQRKTLVHIMGIKCAVGHSYPDCPNMIIGSLEYSFGSFEQARGRVDRVNSKKPATIYCVLNSNSLEETMYDTVACKGDAATICLRGQRVPRDFRPVDMGEVLASSILKFANNGQLENEHDLESIHWPKLQQKLMNNVTR